MPRLSARESGTLLKILTEARRTNQELDTEIDAFMDAYVEGGKLRRHAFIMLPHAVSLEVMAAWLRRNNIRGFDKSMLERVTQAAKIYTAGRKVDITGHARLVVERHYLALDIAER